MSNTEDLRSAPPEERRLHARVAAHASWALTDDPAARTAPARSAFLARFERDVDPDGTLPSEERARRAAHARRAYFMALALKSAVARRQSRALLDAADRCDRDSLAELARATDRPAA